VSKPDAKPFPVMSRYIKSIPWAMLAPHEERAEKNHGQSLKILASRGGLSPSEALDILADRRWNGLAFELPRDRATRDARDRETAEELRVAVETWLSTPGVQSP
jgi:hypothetical protein